MIFIYALRCPSTGAIRYIGKSGNPKRRLLQHISKAREGRSKFHCANWIRGLLEDGLEPAVEVVRALRDDEDWQEAERQAISDYRAAGHPLTNMTDGGDALAGLPAECVQRRIEAQRETLRATWRDQDVRERIRAGRVRYLSAPEVRVKMAADARAQSARPGALEAMSQAAKASWARLTPAEHEAHCANHAAAAKAAWADPEVKARRVAVLQSPEVKAKRYANRDGDPTKVAARVAKWRESMARRKAASAAA